MKPNKTLLLLTAISIVAFCLFRLPAADVPAAPRFEYVTIRWDGKDNTHIIRPGGQVEHVGVELRKARRPDRVDEHAFYMNLVMNGLAKEGYEFAGMTGDEIVMKRALIK
ncbi:MAG TPA: hypothetical protein VFV96_13295 [Verrucomicrobiae bacterium]|nr:hypothetical protein [Verrucomicrobiae bacterium]